jgi:hypothetical protein
VPEIVPVEELILNPLGKDGEIENVAVPPVFVTVKLDIAVPTEAAIVVVDKEITGGLIYLTATMPDDPVMPFVAVPFAEYPPLPPQPVFAERATRL